MRAQRNAPTARGMLHARWIALVAVLVALVVTAGCGSDDDGSSSSTTSEGGTTAAAEPAANPELEQAQADIDKLLQRPTEISLKEPLDPAKEVPTGKTIYFIGCGLPVCKGIGDYFDEAAKVFGWQTKYIDAGLTPETIKAAWQRAVRDKPDAVLVSTGGTAKDIYATELAELKKAGIPVVFNSEVFPANPDDGVVGVVNGPPRQRAAADAEAKWLAAKTNGKGNILLVTSSALANQVTTANQIKDEFLPKYCPDCKLTIYDAPITSVGKDLPDKIAQEVRKNPDVNYLFVQGGNFAIGLPAALAGAGLKDQAPIMIQSQDVTASQDLAKGQYEAIYGLGLPEMMWLAADTFARHWTDQPTDADVAADDIQEWFITPDQVPDTAKDYPMVEDYQAQYKKLWNK